MPTAAVRHRFTVEDFERMEGAGIFGPEERLELIHGEFFDVSAIEPPHSGCVNRLTGLFGRLLGNIIVLSVQNPVQISQYSVAQPDVALLEPCVDFYSTRRPVPQDAILLVEVADSSVDFDRDVKSRVYAGGGVPEYWIVDLAGDALEVYRDPDPAGIRYRGADRFYRGTEIAIPSFRSLTVAVTDVLGS